MSYRSKSQQRWAFANGKKWARKWAHETGEHHGRKGSKAAYGRLPEKAKKKRARRRKKPSR